MKLAIIIVDYNHSPHTAQCQASLKKLRWSGSKKIILINNTPQKNLGFTGANNLGVKQAFHWGADLIMLLNNDTIVHPDLAVELQAANADIAVPKIYFYPRFEFHHARYRPSDRGKVIWYAGGAIDWNNIMGIHSGVDAVDRGQFAVSREVEFATGCCMLIKKAVINKIGLFDDRYYLYLEDLDFSVRARRAGFIIRYQPQAILWHKNAQSIGGSGSTLQDYYFTRNRLLFGFRYASLKTKFALFRQSLKYLLVGNTNQKQAVRDYYFRHFGQR